MKKETKQLLIGAGIGFAIGGATGVCVGISVGKKRERRRYDDNTREMRKSAYNHGYLRGTEDAIEESQKWIKENVLVVDADNPETAQEAINNYFTKSENSTEKDSEPKDKDEEPEQERIFESPPGPSPDPQVNSENPRPFKSSERYILTGDNVVSIRYGTETFEYPKSLFYDENGYSVGETNVRANLLDYEKNPVTLKKIWLALGWGDYFPDPDTIALTEEELNNMDLDIDEQLGDEPKERTLERQIYLDKVEKYRNNPTSSPKIVSQRRFEEDCYLNHIYVDYYDVDNIFVDSTDINEELDAFTMFGVTDGKELFTYKKEHPFPEDEDNNDPEVVHVENFMDNTIAEITRFHKSYASVKDGSAYVDGDAT